MDRNLEALLDKMMRTWVITDAGIYGDSIPSVEYFLEEMFEIYVTEFQMEFPAMFGRVYVDWSKGPSDKLYTRDIDDRMLNLQCVVRMSSGLYNRVVPANVAGISQLSTSATNEVRDFNLSEMITLELYSEFIQNEWNPDLNQAVILYDDLEEADYIVPSDDSFIIFGFKERKMNIKSIPHHMLRPMKYFLQMKIAEVVHDAITKYALEKGIALAEAAANSESTGGTDGALGITPDQISSVHIGNLSLSLMSTNSWSRVSDLLSSGAGQAYLQQLRDISQTNRDKFNREKFIRYSGMIR